MRTINKLIIVLFIILNFGSSSFAENNFFEEGKNKYDEQKYEESKFLFQRSIVFNPKDQNSYLYLAKIYNFEENEKEEKKNINIIETIIIPIRTTRGHITKIKIIAITKRIINKKSKK